ncbi:MAG: sugar transferase [Deltaproteobacteria bacterium]
MKRFLDLLLSLLAMLPLTPVFLVIAVVVKLDSRGPVFYRQERVGKDGVRFRIFKFRTMIVGAYRGGARLTVKRDPRITTVGQVLGWTKMDELPQFLNVLAGDMSLVGPRPEDPYFVNFYDDRHKRVLSVRPGVIGPSQIDGRDELEKYPEGTEDTEQYYIDHILPGKLDRDLDYVDNANAWKDLGFLVIGAFQVLLSQFKGGFIARSRSRLAMLSLDLGLIVVSYVVANLVHFDWQISERTWSYIYKTLLWIVIIRPPVFIYYGLYQRTTRWVGRHDLAAIVKAVSVSTALVVGATYFTNLRAHSRAVFIEDWAMLIFLMVGGRFIVRHVISGASRVVDNGQMTKVLVAGSGHGGEVILRSLLEDPKSRFLPVGIIDHEPSRWGALIHGVRVMGGATDIAMAASTHGVAMVLVSLADLAPAVVRDITEACGKLSLKYRLIPALSDALAQEGSEPAGSTSALSSEEGRP